MNFFKEHYNKEYGFFYSSKLKEAVLIDTTNQDHKWLWLFISDQFKTFDEHGRITPNMVAKLKKQALKVFNKPIECTTAKGLDIQIGLANIPEFNNLTDVFITNLIDL